MEKHIAFLCIACVSFDRLHISIEWNQQGWDSHCKVHIVHYACLLSQGLWRQLRSYSLTVHLTLVLAKLALHFFSCQVHPSKQRGTSVTVLCLMRSWSMEISDGYISLAIPLSINLVASPLDSMAFDKVNVQNVYSIMRGNSIQHEKRESILSFPQPS